MEIIEEKSDLESKFNKSSDYGILVLLDGENLSVKEKKYLIEHCQSRIDQMDIDIFLQMIRQTNQSFCEACNQYLSSKISSLSVSQIEKLLYVNKYYHKVSEIAPFLLNQDWFQRKKDKEYKAFFIAYELEKLLRTESVSKEKIRNIGVDVIDLLPSISGDFMLFDMIMKNYLSLLEKYNPEYFETFKGQGYKKIDHQIASEKELTPNMIIFDCGITKRELKANVDYFEFYEKADDEAFAYAHAGTIRINMAAIEDVYKQYENKKIGTQMIFYVIGHEIDHVYCERYKNNMNNDFKEELRVFNSRISSALQETVNRNFYLEYHNCFSHEFSANIRGIETLYHKQKYLPSITKEDKEKINKLLASILFSSYCLVDGEPTKYGYVGPVEFTREKFKKIKDNLPKFALRCLLNNKKDLPRKLEMIENNLSELEKCLLGYYNSYIGILKLIASGEVNSVNLFDDLPNFYDKYKRLIGEEFPQYSTSYSSDIKRK